MVGYIHLIIGPMFSGKSSELIRLIRRYKLANYKCKVIKYNNDNRYGNFNTLITHDSISIDAISTSLLSDTIISMNDIDVIGIDEGQFFDDIVTYSEYMANNGKIVIISALDGTYQRKPFGKVLELIPLSEKVTKLSAVCMSCFKDASFSKRICDNKEIQLIGGNDKYKSVCRECFFKK
ncbi:thymidine kinase [Brazilian porcupinepox virus 1]|nr:thymidine kinase [Brazilian porcupinepox virus 1]